MTLWMLFTGELWMRILFLILAPISFIECPPGHLHARQGICTRSVCSPTSAIFGSVPGLKPGFEGKRQGMSHFVQHDTVQVGGSLK